MVANGKEQFHLLEARHVDDLTDAVRTLNRSITKLAEIAQKQLTATRELNELMGNANEANKASASEPSKSDPERRKKPR